MSENIAPHTSATLVELLRCRAEEQPHQQAYTFLKDGETDAVEWTYAQLDQQARQIAAWLQQVGVPRDRVLLLYPAGLEYIAAFFGCLYADMIAVPAYPPRLNRPAPRLQAIAADTTAQLALTTTPILTDLQRRFDQMPELKALRWLATDQPENGPAAGDWRHPRLTGETLAFLQYTSGSTNTPIGVQLSHANLLHNLSLIQHGLKVDLTSSFFSWLPLYHDMGLIGNVLEPLYAGIPLVLSSPTSFIERPIRWLQAITRYKSTISGGPNFAYQLCIDRITPEERVNLDLSSWQVAFCAAEPIRAETLERFFAAFASCGFRRKALYPCYGLAEATLIVSGGVGPAEPIICAVERTAIEQNRVVEASPHSDNSQQFVGCGQTLLDQKIVIVDPESRAPVAADQVGEIWTASPSISSGYWQRVEATRTNFQAYLADTNSGPYLRTGDLGFVKNGELFVTGRIKELIIIHGRNYYPQDIEQTAEQSHPALQPSGSAAFSIPVNGQEQLVIVHEVKRSQRHVAVAEVAQAVRRAVAEAQELPIYAVVLVKPSRVPRTSSGKIQRNLCRKEFLAGDLEMLDVSYLGDNPVVAGAEEPLPDFVAPGTPIEQALAGIWGEVLGLNRVGRSDNFFELGGDSLLATQVISQIREMFQVELSLSRLFELPTVAELAEAVSLAAISKQPPLPLQPIPRSEALSLSFAQQRLWFFDQLEPESSAYNIAVALHLQGCLNQEALAQSLNEIVQRHEALRTVFRSTEELPTQVIVDELTLPLPLIDLSQFSGVEQAEMVQRLVDDKAKQPFDLTQPPLVRLSLVQVSQDEHILLLVVHHIICDGWSMGILVKELIALYVAYSGGQSSSPLPHLPIQYADTAYWQRQWLQGERLQQQLGYWQQQLADMPPLLNLPTDRPRPTHPTSQGARLTFELPQSLLVGLKRLSQQEGVTLYMTLLAAFQTLLYRYTGQEDLSVGTPIAGRTRAELENLIGFFVNTLVMRTNLAGSPTFQALLQRVRTVALEAYAHQELPFDYLVEVLRPARHLNHTPLFQVMFALDNTLRETLTLPGLTLTPLELDTGATMFDLTLSLTERNDTLGGYFEYNTALFDQTTIERMLSNFKILLEGIVANPAQSIFHLPLLTDAEQQQLLLAWNDTEVAYPTQLCFQQLFETQVEQTPEAIALIHKDKSLTYRELNQRANQLAHYLNSRGVGQNTPVGLCVERSLEMLVGILGILKAGGVFVPLDPTFPTARLKFINEDTQMPVLLTQRHLQKGITFSQDQMIFLDADWSLISQHNPANPAPLLVDNPLAYIIYTSGSTGRPKGVLISHRALFNHNLAVAKFYELQPKDRVLQFASISFDVAIEEIFPALLSGATVVLAPDEIFFSFDAFQQFLATAQLTVLNLPASFWQDWITYLAQAKAQLPASLRLVVTGSEKVLPEKLTLWQELMGQRIRWLNAYGPTETTITATIYEPVQAARQGAFAVPIGRPIANTCVYLLDAQFNPVPIGAPGELYIGGSGLAAGYLKLPELTAEKFLQNPFSHQPGARLYRTGDLARYLSDGNLEFLGRLDHQVKIRGYRIELGEIEAALTGHPAVCEAAVIAREDTPGEQRLVAYIVPHQGVSFSANELRDFLKEKLPDYMTPAAFVALPEIPLTTTGKINRQALPAPDRTDLVSAESFIAPRNTSEETLAAMWMGLLNLERVGVQDNFFDLGGHSLLATQLISRVRTAFGVEIPLRDLFELPTIANLATLIAQQKAAQVENDTLLQILAELENLSPEEMQRELKRDVS